MLISSYNKQYKGMTRRYKIRIISKVTPRQVKLPTIQDSYPYALDTGVRQNIILHNVPIFKCSAPNIVKKAVRTNVSKQIF